jgi:predicted site-specific integrase-resolvase
MGLSDLPEFIPLDEAAKRHQLSPQVLDQAVVDGTIRVVRIDGDILVDKKDVTTMIAEIQAQDQGDELVSLSEAARRLEVSSATVMRWCEHGWLPVKGTGSRRAKLVSWSSARNLGRMYEERGGQGIRLIPRGKDLSSFVAR